MENTDWNSEDILDKINNQQIAGLDRTESKLSVQNLSESESEMLVQCFDRPACSETIFMVECFLNRSNQRELDAGLELFGLYLKNMGTSREAKSQELLASIGIYFSLFLRRTPNLNFYVSDEHFLIVAQRAYFPYIALYVVHFLVPAVIKGVDLQLSFCSKPAARPGMRPYSKDQKFKTTLKAGIGLAENMNEYEEAAEKTSSEPASKDLKVDSLGNRWSPETKTLQFSVLNKIIDICPLNSPERRILNELRRQYNAHPGFLIDRLGLKTEKLQFGLYLDDPVLVGNQLSDIDLDKAIFLHSNRVVAFHSHLLKAQHFNTAVKSMNFTVAQLTFSYSDWVPAETVDDLIFLSKALRHAHCLEILKLVVQKKIALCQHQIRKLPEEWQASVMALYTTPRWKQLLEPKAKNSSSDEERHATLDYYRLVFSSLQSKALFLTTLSGLEEKLSTESQRQEFTAKIIISNRDYYRLLISSYADLFFETYPTLVNEQDSYLNDILEIPRNFIIPCLEGNQLFLFDYGRAKTLLDSQRNFYNRNPLAPEVLAHVQQIYESYNRLGLAPEIDPISEILEELVNGRQIEQACSCSSNKQYSKKLVRLLRAYNVKDSSLDVVNVQDLVVKLGLISIHLGSKIKDQNHLWLELCQSIKSADPTQRETLKRTIASLILIYSRVGGGYLITM